MAPQLPEHRPRAEVAKEEHLGVESLAPQIAAVAQEIQSVEVWWFHCLKVELDAAIFLAILAPELPRIQSCVCCCLCFLHRFLIAVGCSVSSSAEDPR